MPKLSHGGTHLWWETSGAGPPVLLLPGIATTADSWFRLRERLGEDFNILTMDLRGTGRSGAPIGRYTISKLTEDVVAVLDAAGRPSAHVVGHSLGGIVAQELALEHPDRVRSLVLVSTSPGGRDAVRGGWDAASFLLRRPWLPKRRALRESIPFLYSSDTPAERIAEDTEVRSLHPFSRHGYVQQLAAAFGFRGTAERLSAIDVPTVIIHGSEDRLIPVENAEVLATNIPRARLEVLDGSGHQVFTEREETACAIVLEHLRSMIHDTPTGEEGQDMTTDERGRIDEAVAGLTIPKTFVETARRRPDEPALRWRDGDDWHEWTWDEYLERAARVAGGLRSVGVESGDRVLLMLRNRPEFHIADMGALFLGATPVSIYNSNAPEQIRYIAEHCGASLAIVDDAEFLSRVRKGCGDLLEHVFVLGDGGEGADPFRTLAEHDPVDVDEAVEVAEPDDLLTIIYTSGTTGPPKGVMLSHRNARWTSESFSRCLREPWTGKRMISYLPMAHVAERMTTHYDHVTFGSVVTTCPDTNELGAYLAAVRPQVVFGAPRVWEKLASGIRAAVSAEPDRKAAFEDAMAVGRDVAERRVQQLDVPEDLEERWESHGEVFEEAKRLVGLDECELAITGAAPVPTDVVYFFLAIGMPISEIYGLSETCGPHTWEPYDVKPGTVGPPMPGCEVDIADDGEILCRGGNVFQGYLNDPERTAEALDDDGWLYTGDIGEIDADGYVKIVDRKKDVIITAGGKNVSPTALEAALKSTPLIGQAAVIGDGRPFVSALLTLDPEVAPAWAREHGIEDTSLASLARHPDVIDEIDRSLEEANEDFSRAEQVKKYHLLDHDWEADSKILTPTMKVKRREIFDVYADEIDALYA